MPFSGRSSGGKKKGVVGKGKSRFSSRFNESSDEDDAGASGFRSRFDDSSDEEAAPVPLPRITIPKTMRDSGNATASASAVKNTVLEEDGDSPELPDSSDEEDAVQQPPVRVSSVGSRITKTPLGDGSETGGLRRLRSGRGELAVGLPTSPALGTSIMRGPSSESGHGGAGHWRKTSLMGVLRRKKADPAGKISRGELMESAARRDTNLERSVGELSVLRNNSQRQYPQQQTPQQQQPSSPKLQKRVASMPTHRPESWPFPMEDGGGAEVVAGACDDEKRPSTAGNLGTAALSTSSSRPGFLQRQSMSHDVEIGGGGEGSEAGGSRRKKKFGALRRMFRLND